LLFTLNLYKDAEAYAFDADRTDNFIQNFIDKQFNIFSIEEKYEDFISLLTKKAKEAGIFKSLTETFIENTIEQLTAIKDKARKADTLTELDDIEKNLNSINEKITQLK